MTRYSKFFFTALTLMAAYAISFAQEVTYYLPKTEIAVEITYEEQTFTQGPFYQYAERYLGTKEVIKENGKHYQLLQADIFTKTMPNTDKPFHFTLGADGLNSFVLSKNGILQGINMEEEPAVPAKSATKNNNDKKYTDVAKTMPLLEDQMLAASIAKMAEGAAKQIYRIREARINLLSGEVDKAPADGKSTELILKELDKQEKELTALFTGKTERQRKQKIVTISYEDLAENETIAFRFSQILGLVDTDDLAGEPYYISLNNVQKAASSETNSKQPAASPIWYIVPGSAEVQLTDGTKCITKKQLLFTQLGHEAYIPAAVIKQGATVTFGKAGQILSVKK